MGAAALPLAIIGGGLALGSSISQGYAQSAADKANASIAQQNARYAAEEGETNAGQSEMQNRSITGTEKANQGASGITTNEGSSANVLASQAEVGTLNALTIRSNAARQAYGYEVNSAMDESAAKNAVTEGYLNGASDALKSGAAAYNAFGGGGDPSGTAGAGNSGVSSPTLMSNDTTPAAWDNFQNTGGLGSGVNFGNS